MSTTPLPTLLSNDTIAKVMADEFSTARDHVVACGAGRAVRNIYEADRAKTLAVVQRLVDALEGTKSKPDWWRHHPSEEWIYDALADAKYELGIEPTPEKP